MIDEFKLLSFKSSPMVKDDEAILKYTRLGFFHFEYIESLSMMDKALSIVKYKGDRKTTTSAQIPGTYLYCDIADLSDKNRRISAVFIYRKGYEDIVVADIIQIVNVLRRCFDTDSSRCFTKFDAITFV